MSVVRQQLKRALEMTENPNWDYNPFTNNCQHWSRYVTTSEKRMNQCDILASDYKIEQIDISKSETCKSKPCDLWYFTKQGNYCTKPSNSFLFGKYCYPNKSNPSEYEYVSKNVKPVYGCIKKEKLGKVKKVNKCYAS